MSEKNDDGNIIGRIGAIAVLFAVGFGLRGLNCASGKTCPLMKTSSCCAGADGRSKAAEPAAVAAPVPAESGK